MLFRSEQDQRRLERNADALAATDAVQKNAARAREDAAARHSAALTRATETKSLLGERERLREQAQAAGGDSAQAASRLEQHRPRLAQVRAGIANRTERNAASTARLSALRSGKSAPEPHVAQLRGAFDEAGIAHLLLTEIVEVTDPGWQAAVEALLAPYRHLVLLKRARDRDAAWRIGERLRYRSFVTPDLEPPPDAVAGSVLEIARFTADAPSWLTTWLKIGRAHV